jgi:hypothetical protein
MYGQDVVGGEEGRGWEGDAVRRMSVGRYVAAMENETMCFEE